MNGTQGVVPTLPLATNNYGDGFMGGSGEWIFGLIFLAAIMNGGMFGNGNNQVATTDFVSSEFIKSSISDLNNGMNSGFANVNSNIANGFARTNDNLCDVRQTVATGDMALQNSILDTKYSNALTSCQTQRDILTQTNELNTNLLTTALQGQAKLDSCCCDLKAQGIENTQKILDAMNQNTIDDLRSQVNDLKNTITANGIGTSIVNQVVPRPLPAYVVSSPYQSLYNGFYGSNWFGNTIV